METYLALGGPAAALARTSVVRGPIAVRDYSLLFYAESDAFPAPALIKICLGARTGEPDSEAAQRQYNALARVHKAMMPAPEFSVPQPYFVRPDVALLAMEWIGGVNAAKKAFSWGSSAKRAEAYLARCATWLRMFHGCGRRAPAHLDMQERLPILEQLSDCPVRDDAFHDGLRQLHHSADAAAATALPRAWIHGDFTADNVILSGSRTIGIDLHIEHENAVVYDLAAFLNNMTLSLCEPGGWLLARSHVRLRDAFLRTYCQGETDRMETAVAWVQLYMALQQWRSARQRTDRALRRGFLDFEYRRLTCDLVRRLATQATGRRIR